MAVTQQLVRMSRERADELSTSAAALDALAGFQAAPPADHLDLDWAAIGLLKLAETQPSDVRAAIEQTLHGTARVALGAHPDIYSDVRILSAGEVQRVSESLMRVHSEAVVSVVPDDAREAARFFQIAEFIGNPKAYFQRHLQALLDFVHEAAARRLAIVTWDE